MSGKTGMKGDGLGGHRPGSGRKSKPIGTIIMDCMPMMADVVSGATHRPREQRRNESPLTWAKQTHAWPRIVGLLGPRRTANPTVIAKRDEPGDEHYAPRVKLVRQALGYDDALVLKCGQVLAALQSDGVRAALTDQDPPPTVIHRRKPDTDTERG